MSKKTAGKYQVVYTGNGVKRHVLASQSSVAGKRSRPNETVRLDANGNPMFSTYRQLKAERKGSAK